MKHVRNGWLILGETLAVIMTIVIHEALISRWLPPLASAFTSGILVTLAVAPILYRRRLVSGKRLLVGLVSLAGLIYVLAVMG